MAPALGTGASPVGILSLSMSVPRIKDVAPGCIGVGMIGGGGVDEARCPACRWPAVVPANLTASVGDGTPSHNRPAQQG